MSKKRLSKIEQMKLLNEYYNRCVVYYKDPTSVQALRAVIAAERECTSNGIRSSEITKARFSALHEVEAYAQ